MTIVFLDGVSVLIDNWPLITGILLFFAAFTIPLFAYFRSDLLTGSGQRHQPVFSSTHLFLALFLIISLLIRLAYVSKALFPSYFDSAQHYTLIKNIMINGLSQVFEIWYMEYYHLGFHFLATLLASIFPVEITTVMLVLGQIILVLMPLPFFFIIKDLTRSNWAGMFAVILSAFGWYMPARGVDWGKYPALMSLGMILFVICLVYLFAQNKDELQTGKRTFFLVMVGSSIFFTALVHSRSLIVLGIVAIAWMMSVLWMKFPQLLRHSTFALLFLILVFAVIFIQRSDILSLLFDPYLNQGVIVTSLIAVLSIFAYRSYPHPVVAIVIATCLLLISIYIPVNGLFSSRPYLTLMDRPYVEMILFIPVTMLGSLGLAGLEKRIARVYSRYLALIFMGWIVYHAFTSYSFYPSGCCVIVGNDDAVAMAWMEDQLPSEARIGIASTQLKVVEGNVIEGYVGADAGVWITPLTGRATVLLPNETEFDRQIALGFICRMRISHLFVGELGQSFDNARLNSHPEWYRPLLTMPRTRVYEVIGCDDV